jgi:diacylglycerol kinase family enzyme
VVDSQSVKSTGVGGVLQEEIPAHVDGEMLAGTRHFRARVLPGTLRVVGP